MRIVVGMHQAKTTLSELVRRVRAGDEVVIASNGEPVARLVAFTDDSRVRAPGSLTGQIAIAPDFDALPPGFEIFDR